MQTSTTFKTMEPNDRPAVDAIFQVQIGVHSDLLYDRENIQRSPEIATISKITLEPTSVAANPWGGLIYVLVRAGCTGY